MRCTLTKSAGLAVLLSSLLLSSAHAVDLETAYRSAQSYDAELLAAQAARLEAEEGIPVARAGLLPQVSYSRQRNKANTTNYQLSTGRSSDTGDYFTGSESLTLRQPIYRKSAWAALSSAQAQSEAADANYRKEEQNLGLRVTTTYLDVLLARAGLALANAEAKALDALVTLAERGLKSGTGTRTDVDDARARRDMSRARVSEANMRLSQTSQDFRTVTDIDASRLPAIDPRSLPSTAMALTGRAEWMARIEATSPELQSLRKQLEAADAEVERAKGGHYPSIDMVVSRQEGKSETNTTVGTGYRTDYIGVQLSVPLISGFGVMAQVRQAQAHTERVRQVLESTRRKLLAEAERLYLALELGIEKVQAIEQAILSAEQALISAQKGVAAGTRTIVDVLDSEQRVFLAKRDQAFSVFELANNRLKFLALADAIDDAAIKYASAWLAAAKL
jgi:outer membrane protein/protease secretion system outer membrane protein